MDNERLYIPYGLSTEQEFFTGFGKSEVKQCAIGMAAFVFIAAIIYLVSQSVGAVVATVIIGIAGCIIMTRKDQVTRLSVVGQIINIIKFRRSQKVYKYIYKSACSAGIQEIPRTDKADILQCCNGTGTAER